MILILIHIKAVLLSTMPFNDGFILLLSFRSYTTLSLRRILLFCVPNLSWLTLKFARG